eukprot:m.1585860 g.1585860  ORF g.1585860 m.1585860 type:complete len:2436 (+) comp25326_c0_seq1:243-7550(+)
MLSTMAGPPPPSKVPEPFPVSVHTALIRSANHGGGSFDINVNPESAFSKCLDAALELLIDGRATADSHCMEFLTDTMEVCFSKLHTSHAGSGWDESVHRNIRTLTIQAMEVAAIALNQSIVAPMNTVCIAFDSTSAYNQTNCKRASEKTMENPFARQCLNGNRLYGWLTDFVNTFGFYGGFEQMMQLVSKKEQGAVGILMLAQFIKPLGGSIDVLTPESVRSYVLPIATQSIEYVKALKGDVLKAETAPIAQHDCLRSIMGVLQGFIRSGLASRLPDPVDERSLAALHLSTLLKILRGDSFNGVMHALNEMHDIIHQVNGLARKRNQRNTSMSPGLDTRAGVISSEAFQQWLLQNNILAVLFGNHLHHAQYVQKLEEVVKFMISGGALSLEHLSSMWQAQVDKHETISNNIHNLLAKLACELDTQQLDHLFQCFQNSWGGSIRNMERLLDFIRRLGEEDSEGNVAPKVLDVMWNIAHTAGVPTEIVQAARSSHVDILAYGYIKDKPSHRVRWIKACLDDIERDVSVVFATKHLHKIFCKYVYDNDGKSVRPVTAMALERLDATHNIRGLMVRSLERYMARARAKLKDLRHANDDDAVAAFTTVEVEPGHAHHKAVRSRLQFLKIVVSDSHRPLDFTTAHRVWTALMQEPCCPEDVDLCLSWFTLTGTFFLSNDGAHQMYVEEILKLDVVKCTAAAYSCFESFFNTINDVARNISITHAGICVHNLNLHGKDVLLNIAFRCPDNAIAMKAIDMVKRIYTCLSNTLRLDQVISDTQLLDVAIAHMKRAHLTMKDATQGPAERQAAALVIQRSLTLLTEFIAECDSTYFRRRSNPPHGQSFVGDQLCLTVSLVSNRVMNAMGIPRGTVVTDTLTLYAHGNETVRDFLVKLGALLRTSVDRLQVVANGAPLVSDDHSLRLTDLSIDNDAVMSVMLHVDEALCEARQLGQVSATLEERLPGHCLAQQPEVIGLLFDIGSMGGPTAVEDSISRADNHLVVITNKVSELLTLLPTATDDLATTATEIRAGGVKAQAILTSIFEGTSMLRLVYALEVLCRVLFPVVAAPEDTPAAAGAHRPQDAAGVAMRASFVACGGVRYLCLCVQQQQTRILQQRTARDTDRCRASVRLCLRMLNLIFSGGYHPGVAKSASGTYPVASRNQTPPPANGTKRPSAVASSVGIDRVGATDPALQQQRHDRCRELVDGSSLSGLLSSMASLVHAAAMGLIQPVGTQDTPAVATVDVDGDTIMDGNDVTSAHVLSDDRKLAKEALDILYTLLVAFPDGRAEFVKSCYGWSTLQSVLLGSSDEAVRQELCDKFSTLAKLDSASLTVLFQHALEAQSQVDENSQTCAQFFTLLCTLYQLHHTAGTGDDSRALTHLAAEVEWLRMRCECQVPIEGDLELLAGHLKLCAMLVSLHPAARDQTRKQLLPGLLANILFPASTELAAVMPVDPAADADRSVVAMATEPSTAATSGDAQVGAAKTNGTPSAVITDSVRRAAFEMVVGLCAGSTEGVARIVEKLESIHFKEDSLITEFDHEPSISDRGVSGYVGLKNAGATCYMNSVLQQMYMQPQIRSGLLSGGNNVVLPEERTSSVLYQLQKITAHLNQTKMQFYTPKGFWQAYRHDGEPVNMREQQDCHDFFTGVIDQIDEKLHACGRPKLFENVYGGLFADQKKITKGCEHQYEREESFMTLQLDVRNFGSLQESLQQYVKGDLLEGANAYHCENCGVKRDAIKRTCLKKLPSVLVIHLKRFEFDWERDVAVKYNGLFEFPKEFDMGPYTVEGLDAKETAGKPGAKPAPVYNYKLAGVTVHSGQANGGHYYSFIRSRGDPTKWYRFDDADVTECEVDDSFMAKELFGGTYVTDVWDPNGRRYVQRSKERWWNGYLLFYERVEPEDATAAVSMSVSETEDNAATSPSASPTPNVGAAESPVDDPSIVVDVQDQNLQFNHRKEIFNQEYFSFMLTLWMQTIDAVKEQRIGKSDAEQVLHKTTVVAGDFFINYVLRLDAAVRGALKSWLELFTALFRLYPRGAMVILERMNNAELNHQLFFQCSNEEVRQMFMNLLMHVISVLRTSKTFASGAVTHAIETYFSDSIVPLVGKHDMFAWWKNMNTLFQVCTQYARMDPHNRQFLHSMKLTERCVSIMATVIRGNSAGLQLPQGRALCEFVSTMLRCVALPSFSEYAAKGLDGVSASMAVSNPFFEDLSVVDNTDAPEESMAVKVLMPTPELMESLPKCRYFVSGIHAPMSVAFQRLLLYLSFCDVEVGNMYLNQLLEMTYHAEINPPVSEPVQEYFQLLRDLVVAPHESVPSSVLSARINAVFMAANQHSYTYFDVLETSIPTKVFTALAHVATLGETNPTVRQFLRQPATVTSLARSVQLLRMAISQRTRPDAEYLRSLFSRMVQLVPQLAESTQLVDDVALRSTDDSGSDSDGPGPGASPMM